MTSYGMGPGWASEVAFEALGVSCLVRSNDPDFGATVEHLMMDFSVPSSSPRVVFSVIRDGDQYQLFDRERVRVRVGSRSRVLMRVLRMLNRELVNQASSLAIHAGAVAHRGEVVAFPGPPGAGKSTFVAACLQRELGYVTDEIILIEPGLDVVPYPKALWLSEKARRLLDVSDEDLTVTVESRYKAPVVAKVLGGSVAESPLRLGHVVVLERGQDRLELERLDPGEVAYKTLRRAFNRYARPGDWFGLAAEMARGAKGWRLSYRDPVEAADLLAERLW